MLLSNLDEKVSCGWPPWICQYSCDILLSISVFSKKGVLGGIIKYCGNTGINEGLYVTLVTAKLQ